MVDYHSLVDEIVIEQRNRVQVDPVLQMPGSGVVMLSHSHTNVGVLCCIHVPRNYSVPHSFTQRCESVQSALELCCHGEVLKKLL